MRRDKLHLRAPGNWINDPNGFIYYKGIYHLFYQHFPYEPRWGTMHWGHAVSRDLVTWEHHGIALYPSKYWDQNGCFSGSAVEHDGTLRLYYTGIRYELVSPDNIHRSIDEQFEASQLMLISPDGVRFDNTEKRLIIPPILDASIGDRRHTRDPKVWRSADGRYHMVLGTTVSGRGRLLFYESGDGLVWTYQNGCGSASDALGYMWECPDLFQVGGVWVLCMSPIGIVLHDSPAQQSVCAAVDFDEEQAALTLPDSFSLIDYGGDLYAPQSTTDREGRRVLIAWIRMPEPVKDDIPWSGMMCAPRLVEVRNGCLVFPLHPNVRAAFTMPVPVEAPFNGKIPTLFTLELAEGETLSIGGYRVFRKESCICVDRSACCPDVSMPSYLAKTPPIAGKVQLDILVDAHMVEVYVNQGTYVLSQIVYHLNDTLSLPENAGAKRFMLAVEL